MDVGKLTAEAFGSGRLEILRAVRAKPLRYTDLARTLEVSEGELSRHLQRLHASGLVEKQANGAFLATPLARLALRYEPGLDVLAKHAEYFRTHDVDSLDERFLLRIEELGYADFLTDPLVIMDALQELVGGVRSRFDAVCLVAQHVANGSELAPLRGLDAVAEANGTPLRLVVMEEERDLGVQVHQRISPRFAYRTLPSTRVDMCVSDRMGIVSFATRDGRLDYAGAFVGSDPRFLQWCSDYFDHQWASAKPVSEATVRAAAAQTRRPAASPAAD